MSKFDETVSLIKAKLVVFLTEHRSSLKLEDEWSDDHIPCCSFTANDVKFEMWYCGSELIGAVMYASESDKALQDIFNVIDHSEMLVEAMEFMEDSEEGSESKYKALIGIGVPEQDLREAADEHKSL